MVLDFKKIAVFRHRADGHMNSQRLTPCTRPAVSSLANSQHGGGEVAVKFHP